MSSCTEQFGQKCREEQFMLDNKGVFFNHGSYGAIPRSVLQHQIRLKEQTENHPDDWYRNEHTKGYMHNLKLFCEFVGAQPENTVFVENVTTGMQAALSSVDLQPGDQILVMDWVYNGVDVLVNSFTNIAEVVYLKQKFPIKSQREILESFEQSLQAHPKVKVAFIDHITSPTSVLLPVKDLCEICKKHDVISIIDAAHAPGQLHLEVEKFGADFYTGNLHKWLYTPRGCAFLWCSPAHRATLRPAVVSHFHGQDYSHMHYDFCIRGTIDNTPYHSVQHALQFADDIGGWESIRQYNEKLCRDAVNHLAAAWGTERLEIPPDMEAPFMKLVRVPNMANYDTGSGGAGSLERDLRSRYHVQVTCRSINDQLYIRVSCNVYNTMDDVIALEKAVLDLASEEKREKNETSNGCPIMHWDLSPLTDFDEDDHSFTDTHL